jgi:hypothetical protein
LLYYIDLFTSKIKLSESCVWFQCFSKWFSSFWINLIVCWTTCQCVWIYKEIYWVIYCYIILIYLHPRWSWVRVGFDFNASASDLTPFEPILLSAERWLMCEQKKPSKLNKFHLDSDYIKILCINKIFLKQRMLFMRIKINKRAQNLEYLKQKTKLCEKTYNTNHCYLMENKNAIPLRNSNLQKELQSNTQHSNNLKSDFQKCIKTWQTKSFQ